MIKMLPLFAIILRILRAWPPKFYKSLIGCKPNFCRPYAKHLNNQIRPYGSLLGIKEANKIKNHFEARVFPFEMLRGWHEASQLTIQLPFPSCEFIMDKLSTPSSSEECAGFHKKWKLKVRPQSPSKDVCYLLGLSKEVIMVRRWWHQDFVSVAESQCKAHA